MIASTQRLVRWACLILATSLPLLLIPAQARAAPVPVTITVGGVDYDIDVVEGEWNVINETAALQSQPWWGNMLLALDFAAAYNADPSTPLFIRTNFSTAFDSDPEIVLAAYAVRYPGGGEVSPSGTYRTGTNRYATATLSVSSVPEINAGSLSQALLILFALWLVTRRRAASHVA